MAPSTAETPMRLIHFEVFKALGHIPRSDEPVESVTIELLSPRNKCMVVFISHRWFRPHSHSREPHPDTETNSKFFQIVEGIEALSKSVGEEVSFYIWIDFFCINQDSSEQKHQAISSLPAYIANSDCIFTPFSEANSFADTSCSPLQCFIQIFGRGESTEFDSPLPFSYDCCSNSGVEYFGRAWCRLEMQIAREVKLPTGGFNYFASQSLEREGRPHFFSIQEYNQGSPVVLPPLGQRWLNKLHPLQGQITFSRDWKEIREISEQFPIEELQVSYVGSLMYGQKNGFGTQVYHDGSRYQGNWKNDKRNGKGLFVCFSGLRYQGNWEDDLKHGNGTLYMTNGDVYEGAWNQGKREGKGTLHIFKGGKLESEWRDDNIHGEVIVYYENGDRYEGNWQNGKKHGKGKLFYEDGNSLEGEWKNDKIIGKGKLTQANETGNLKDLNIDKLAPVNGTGNLKDLNIDKLAPVNGTGNIKDLSVDK